MGDYYFRVALPFPLMNEPQSRVELGEGYAIVAPGHGQQIG